MELKRKLMKRMLKGKQMPFNITFLLFFLWRLRYAHRIKQFPKQAVSSRGYSYIARLIYIYVIIIASMAAKHTIYERHCTNRSSHCVCVRYNDITYLCVCGLFMLFPWCRCTVIIYVCIFILINSTSQVLPTAVCYIHHSN